MGPYGVGGKMTVSFMFAPGADVKYVEGESTI
jgi:hypothetical protein